MLTLFGQAFGLHLQTLKSLGCGRVLGFERAQPHRQLMSMILVLPRFLTHAVEAFAQAVALGQQQFALLGVQRHAVEGFLQVQARFADLFVLQGTLLAHLGDFFVQASAAQGQLFSLGFARRELGLEFALLARFVLQQTAQVFAAGLLLTLGGAQGLQLGFQAFQSGFALFAFGDQVDDFLASGQNAAFRFTGTAHPQEVATHPVAITADQAFTGAQLAALGQRLFQGIHWFDLAQPWRQINGRLNLVQQAARHARAIGCGAEQTQITLGKTGQVEAAKIIHQHGLQVGAQHGFYRQFPAGLHFQAFGQSWTLGQVLVTQPFGGAGAWVQGGLLQGFEGRQAPVQPLQIALGLLLCLGRLLQLLTQLLQALHLLFFAGFQLFQRHFAFGQLLAQFHDRCVFRIGGQQRTFFLHATLALGQALHAGFQLLDTRLLHLGLAARLGGLQVERVPLLLPAVHGGFGFFQGGGGFFGCSAGDFLLGGEHVQLLPKGQQQGTIVAQVRLRLQSRALGFLQVVLQLAQALLAVLDALLHTGNIAAHRIETALHQIEAFRQVMVTVTQALDAGVGVALLGHQRFKADFLGTDDRFALANLVIQRLPTQGR